MEDDVVHALRRLPGVIAAYVVDGSGVAGPPPAADVERAQGGLLAALFGALRTAAADLAIGSLDDLIVEAENGAIVAGALAGQRAAVVLTAGKANLGLIRMELRKLRRSA